MLHIHNELMPLLKIEFHFDVNFESAANASLKRRSERFVLGLSGVACYK